MSTTEDTSAIDEKKAEESGTSTTSPDFKGFISNYLSSIIFTIGISIFVIGGLGLYTTKVAQSNILPDNIELAPYTIIDRTVKEIPIDINVMRPSLFSENKDTLSQKIIFNSQEYLDSFNKSFLCSLKKSADPNAGLFANAPLFFSNVYDNIVAKNFLAINTIFLYLSYLPESAIMFLYGIFGIFLWIGLYFFNVCISIFYHIINIPQLFRTVSENNDKKWESIEQITFLRFIKFILFFFIWIPVGAISAFLTPAFFTIYGLISPLFASYNLKQTSATQNKNMNVIDFIKDTFAYKKFFFFVLATLSLLSNGIKYLGTNAIVGIIIAIIFAYFMGLYSNEMPESGTDGFSLKIRQNIKQAPVSDIDLTNTKLVQICETIPIEDAKLDKIIENGTFRQLTKPKEIGGDGYIEEDIIHDINKSDTQLQTQTDSELISLQNQLNKLQTQLKNANTNVGHQVEASQRDVLESKLKSQIQDIEEKIKNLTQGQSQSGGRKNKYHKHNTKYNIRWT